MNILYDGRGSFTGIMGINRDITERRRAEEEVRKSEERYRTIFESAASSNLILAEDTTILLANTNFEHLSGYSREEMEGKMSWTLFVVGEDLERMKRYHRMRRDGSGPVPSSYEFRLKTHSGEIRNLFMTVSLLPGTKESIVSIIDVTEQKNLEEQLSRAQKMEAIGTLAGGIAHDFNNLLTGILGNISLTLMDVDEGSLLKERLVNVEEYVRRGSDLTKQLLGFARGGKYEVRPTDLGKFIRKSSEMFGRTKKEIRIHTKIPEGLWTVEVDRGQMDQVFLNLYVNAWQAMPEGGDLYLSAENVELDEMGVSPYDIKPGRFVKAIVADTGTGMDETTQARIFEPFFTTKERGRGTGLGLASAYGIIKNHGGFIRVESQKGLGSSFMIYLPASEKEVAREQGVKEEIRKGRETILLIDDEDMILDIGSKMLEGLGYKVITAAGGRLGIEILQRDPGGIDLVILDMIMPDFGGKETFEAVRRISPSLKVLLSSGYSLDSQAEEIMQRGCRGFIQKPFTMAQLSKKVRGVLERT
jgi:PAS domain S-box-containing protein